MFQFARFASNRHDNGRMTLKGRVSPFGHPRIKGCSRLPAAYRRVPRPSSPLGAKAFTKCPYLTLDHFAARPPCRDKPQQAKPAGTYPSTTGTQKGKRPNSRISTRVHTRKIRNIVASAENSKTSSLKTSNPTPFHPAKAQSPQGTKRQTRKTPDTTERPARQNARRHTRTSQHCQTTLGEKQTPRKPPGTKPPRKTGLSEIDEIKLSTRETWPA